MSFVGLIARDNLVLRTKTLGRCQAPLLSCSDVQMTIPPPRIPSLAMAPKPRPRNLCDIIGGLQLAAWYVSGTMWPTKWPSLLCDIGNMGRLWSIAEMSRLALGIDSWKMPRDSPVASWLHACLQCAKFPGY